MQYFLNMEIMRWTLATGESAMTGIIRLSRHFAWIFLLAQHHSLDDSRLGQRSGRARSAGCCDARSSTPRAQLDPRTSTTPGSPWRGSCCAA